MFSLSLVMFIKPLFLFKTANLHNFYCSWSSLFQHKFMNYCCVDLVVNKSALLNNILIAIYILGKKSNVWKFPNPAFGILKVVSIKLKYGTNLFKEPKEVLCNIALSYSSPLLLSLNANNVEHQLQTTEVCFPVITPINLFNSFVCQKWSV